MTHEDDNMINVHYYVEIPHTSSPYGVGIGIVEGTDDLYLERFMKVYDDTVTVKATTFFSGAKNITKNKGIAMRDEYIQKLNKAYQNNQRLRKAMEPIVHDFHCITGSKTRTLEL